MAKKASLLRNRDPKREEADKTGWSIGFLFLNVDPDIAYQRLILAGLTVYREDERFFGPKEEANKFLQTMPEI